MGGPVGAAASERAGDEGEYHHSRNLTKNIESGSKILRESSRVRGDVRSMRRMRARMPVFDLEDDLAAAAAIPCALASIRRCDSPQLCKRCHETVKGN